MMENAKKSATQKCHAQILICPIWYMVRGRIRLQGRMAMNLHARAILEDALQSERHAIGFASSGRLKLADFGWRGPSVHNGYAGVVTPISRCALTLEESRILRFAL